MIGKKIWTLLSITGVNHRKIRKEDQASKSKDWQVIWTNKHQLTK